MYQEREREREREEIETFKLDLIQTFTTLLSTKHSIERSLLRGGTSAHTQNSPIISCRLPLKDVSVLVQYHLSVVHDIAVQYQVYCKLMCDHAYKIIEIESVIFD